MPIRGCPPIAPVNTVTLLPQPTPQKAVLPFMDPAFATAVCRFDLGPGPIKLSLAVSQGYTAVSFYTCRGVPFYAINDRAAGRRVIELYLMTSEQHSAMPEEEDVTAADRLIVEAPERDRPDPAARACAGAEPDGRSRADCGAGKVHDLASEPDRSVARRLAVRFYHSRPARSR